MDRRDREELDAHITGQYEDQPDKPDVKSSKGEVVNLGMPKTTSDTSDEFVVYHAIECRDGDMLTELYKGRDGEAAVYTLQNQHYDETSHTGYWHYKIERSHGRIVDPAKGQW